jgi:hypothetical protein
MPSNSSSTGANTFGAGEPGIRRPLNVDELDSEASEFSWGGGLEPKSVRGKPPNEGGRYRGTSPPCDPQIGVGRH